ncbi:pentatricopeptide repeat-containing protein At2g17670 [Mercurialis annua]|uniref:pentatricopeptide repeat-containing protein At2g17670 n=1 Tax=Mercurialis annua TaxID=3986 RepID=UPI002160EC6C|nr:pentatricopeptide repeat-containing protein At2g17670 [Mercurialis annua]
MGKFRPSLTTTSLIKKPNPSEKPHHFPKKINKFSQETLQTTHHKKPIFQSPHLNEAKKLFNSFISTTNVPLDLRFHNSFLQSYTSISTIDDSISLLHHMIKSLPSLTPNLSTYHILLSQSCKTPDPTLSPVHQILNLMVNNGLNPTQGTVDIVVRSLCSVGREDEAVHLLKELAVKHSKPDTFTYNFLVKCLCKCRALSSVYSFIDEMRSQFDLKPDLVTYTILIDSVCNSKNLREAMKLLSMLKECGFKPDCFVYNTIMKGYCMMGRGSEAIEVLKKMKEEDVEPDLVTYNTLIFGLSKGGRIPEAKMYFRIMVELGHFPDAVTYTSLMNGLCRKGDALGALAMLEEMEKKGCSPNSCTYNTLLHGLCKGRLLEKGIELYKAMKEDGMQLDTASYATFVRSLCREGKVAEAYEVFDYALESKSLNEVAAYTTLESTLKWLRNARERGLAV